MAKLNKDKLEGGKLVSITDFNKVMAEKRANKRKAEKADAEKAAKDAKAKADAEKAAT